MMEMSSPTQGRPSSLTEGECQEQVQRILKSATFRNSVTLQQLLQFLTARAFEPGGDALKEYTIGIEAFGRSVDFDPKTDTIVRVQIHRLRQKLADYYESDGDRDQILVEIPKGHYIPTFALALDPGADRAPVSVPKLDRTDPSAARTRESETSETSAAGHRFPLFSLRNALVGIAAILAFAAGYLVRDKILTNRNSLAGPTAAFSGNPNAPADSVRAFWSSFIGNDSAPVIAFPDAVFLLDDWNDLFRFRRGASDDRGSIVEPHLAQQFASNPALVAKAGQLYYENGYTGAGELQGIAMLSNLFGQMGIRATVKPSRDVTPDDLRQHNVILIGSSFQNVATAQLTTAADFRFDNPDTHHEQWRGQIVNSHPKPNEASTFHTERDPVTRALEADYGLITIEPGIVPGRNIAVLGGLDTTGTEGVILFATSRQGVESLSKALGVSSNSLSRDEVPFFQALVRIQLEKGYGVLGTNLLSVHPIASAGPRATNGAPAQNPNR